MLNSIKNIMIYKDHTIIEDQRNPYSKKPEFMYYLTDEGVQHDGDGFGEDYKYTGNCSWADALEEAKEKIDSKHKNKNNMKTAIISFAGDNKKDITITGANLRTHQENVLLNIKDGEDIVFSVLLNQLVYVQLSK